MGTRYPPYNAASLWKTTHPDYDLTIGPRMNSLPHFELFSMGLHHLVGWVATGTVPPRAERLEIGPDGYLAKDEHGNTRGGVRSAQLDVPHSTYRPNPVNADGTPSYITHPRGLATRRGRRRPTTRGQADRHPDGRQLNGRNYPTATILVRVAKGEPVHMADCPKETRRVEQPSSSVTVTVTG